MQHSGYKASLGIPGLVGGDRLLDPHHLRWSRRNKPPRVVPVPPTQAELADLFPEDPANFKT